ncbi:DMT family transporter [Streptomyces sp. NBC_01506]|uniref:DMT family transporter n=1 Tax=Streptomyces sp. NBC_01506 TaxID=2903887 RepID=UPI003867C97F
MSDNSTPTPARSWLMLLLAGGFEIGYALAVGGSQGFTILPWSLVAVVFFLLTLYALSAALRTIDVGIGYAVWAGIGAVGAALFGPLFFDETLTPAKALWLAVIISGVVWLKLSDRQKGAPTTVDASRGSGQEVTGRTRDTQTV